jgi:hypothetical protein
MRFDGEVNLIGANGGLMLKMSIADGTPTAWQAERAGFGLPSNPTLFAEAIQLHRPDTECSSVNIADSEALPNGIALSDFGIVMFSGSSLDICDQTPAVTRQIESAPSTFVRWTKGPVIASDWAVRMLQDENTVFPP